MHTLNHNFIQIGDLARQTRKTVRTLRFYEEKGLLKPTDHTEGGFRLYKAEDAKRIRLIERLQELGFSLERIRELLEAWKGGGTGEGVALKLQGILEGSLKDTRERIGRLKQMEQELVESLHFLEVCRSCQDRPGRVHCTECEKGDHRAALPVLVDAMVR